jgi:hypothetical protein
MKPLFNYTETQVKKLNDDHPHEIFAVTLLLCTPSKLSRSWTNNKTLDKAKKEVKKLPLSDDMKKHAVQVMQDLTALKPFFKGIADLQGQIYAGPEPHPHGSQAAAIIRALQKLDPKP